MSDRSTLVQAHALWTAVENTTQLLRSVETSTDGNTRSSVDDLFGFLAAVSSLRDRIDTDLVMMSSIDNVNAHFSNVAALIANYAANPTQPQYLAQALAHADNVRSQLATIPRSAGSPAARGAITRALRDYTSELEASREQLATRLTTAISEAQSREDALARATTAAQAALAELETRIGTDESRLNDALTANNEAFIAAQTSRDKTLRDWLQGQESEFEQLAQPHLTLISEAATAAEADREAISALRTSTEDLASIASGDILAGQFQRHSAAERWAAYVAYGVGLTATVGGVIVLLFAFGHATDPLPWQILALKLSITAGIGGIATVAFRFGGKATQRATSFKRQELELRALGPFLANVDGAEGAKIAFAKRAFGHAWEVPTGTQEREPADLIPKLTDLVKAISSSAKTVD